MLIPLFLYYGGRVNEYPDSIASKAGALTVDPSQSDWVQVTIQPGANVVSRQADERKTERPQSAEKQTVTDASGKDPAEKNELRQILQTTDEEKAKLTEDIAEQIRKNNELAAERDDLLSRVATLESESDKLRTMLDKKDLNLQNVTAELEGVLSGKIRPQVNPNGTETESQPLAIANEQIADLSARLDELSLKLAEIEHRNAQLSQELEKAGTGKRRSLQKNLAETALRKNDFVLLVKKLAKRINSRQT